MIQANDNDLYTIQKLCTLAAMCDDINDASTSGQLVSILIDSMRSPHQTAIETISGWHSLLSRARAPPPTHTHTGAPEKNIICLSQADRRDVFSSMRRVA